MMQCDVPIYERFRGMNINISKREKLKMAEKMLKMGYSKYDVVKFLEGRTEELEAENQNLPDYRNP